MKQFEIGKSYKAYQEEYTPIKILRRTERFIYCENDKGNIFRMMVRLDKDGNEYAVDTSVPVVWREAFTYFSEAEVR